MDIYAATLDFMLKLKQLDLLPEMLNLFSLTASKRPRDWRLPSVACEAVGGKSEQSIPAIAAIACLHLSILLIDDLLDAEVHREWQHLSQPVMADLAAAFQAVGLEILFCGEGGPAPLANLIAMRQLNLAALTTATGQYWDVKSPVNETDYWRVVKMKSAPFFSVAFQTGALLGGASLEVAEQLKIWGCLYGELIQIHDDLRDVLAVPANPDWVLGRSPLPILYAQAMEYPDRARFLELRQQLQTMPDEASLAEAQDILIRCGAISYGIHALLQRYQHARNLLNTITLPSSAGFESLLAELHEPVQALFSTLGLELPESSRRLAFE